MKKIRRKNLIKAFEKEAKKIIKKLNLIDYDERWNYTTITNQEGIEEHLLEIYEFENSYTLKRINGEFLLTETTHYIDGVFEEGISLAEARDNKEKCEIEKHISPKECLVYLKERYEHMAQFH